MIVGLSVGQGWAQKHLELPTAPLTAKRRQVVYNAAIEKLRTVLPDISAIAIPRTVAKTDYDFEYLIEHIRIDEDEKIARAPIVVATGSDDEWLEWLALPDEKSTFKEDYYRNIAVLAPDDPDAIDLEVRIDPEAWRAYQAQAGSAPRDATGRHDQANAWGAYVLLWVLAELDKRASAPAALIDVQRKLLEDTFYKKHIRQLRATKVDDDLVSEVKHERGRLKNRLKAVSKVLVVEDQLQDGWMSAYCSVLSPPDQMRKILFASDMKDAKSMFSPAIDVVLLDVRLAVDRDIQCQNENDLEVDQLSGGRLARWFHEKGATVPVIAATASNKSRTLEDLLNHGLSNYWVKASPETIKSAQQAFTNVLDLYRKLRMTLEWSQRTRPWVDALNSLAERVDRYDRATGQRLMSKSRSLHALLFSPFSPFRDEIAKGLQLNLAYLIAFSCMNDLIGWICEVETDERTGDKAYYMTGKDGRKRVDPKGEGSKNNPTDRQIARGVLRQLDLAFADKRFISLNTRRNKLPLTHGKVEDKSSSWAQVEDQHISDLVEILVDLSIEWESRIAD